MTTEKLAPEDVEAIAAFIDGRMSEEARRKFLERLDTELALYEVFVETARQGEGAAGQLADAAGLGTPRRASWRRFAIAAGLVVALGVPFLTRVLGERTYGEMLVANGRLSGSLRDGWHEPSWSELRSGQTSLGEVRTAFRLGVSVVDLEVALRAGRSSDAQVVIVRVERLLQGAEEGGSSHEAYREVRRRIAEGATARKALRLAVRAELAMAELLSDVLEAYELGKWSEAGRLAAESGNRTLLESSSFIQRSLEFADLSWSQELGEALQRSARLLSASPTTADLREVADSFRSILGAA